MSEILTGAGWFFCAAHKDPLSGQIHGHTWEVKAWWPGSPWRDARVLQQTLKTVLAAWDHTEMPPELHSGEAMAHALLQVLTDCVRVDIERPSERIFASAVRT